MFVSTRPRPPARAVSLCGKIEVLKKTKNRKIFRGLLLIGFALILFSAFYLVVQPLSQKNSVSSYFGSFSFSKEVSVLNFGDVMFDRGVRNIIYNRDRDPFEYVKRDISVLKKYDFVIANLEGPIIEIDRKLCQQKAYNFQFASNTPERLKSVGINIVNIANNHNYDCYKRGFESTKRYLDEAGVAHMGDVEIDKSYLIKEIKGKKIAFVGIDALTSPIPVLKFYPLVKKLKSENDYVVVNIHWGEEYNLGFTKNQREIAHKLIDNGVDVIFGHHPHVIEPVEIYKNSVIFYSLGNFVFDQDFGDTTFGIGAGVKFSDTKKVFEIYPYNMRKFAPEFMKADEKEKFCERVLESILHTGCQFEIKV